MNASDCTLVDKQDEFEQKVEKTETDGYDESGTGSGVDDAASKKQDNKNVCLDNLIGEFNSFQKFSTELYYNNIRLQEKIRTLNKVIKTKEDIENLLREEKQKMQPLIKNLQDTLNKRCDYEDENRKLRDDLEAKVKEAKEIEDVHLINLQEKDDNHESMLKQYKQEMTELSTKLKETAQADRNALQQRIEEKDKELQNLQKQISDLEREKQAELVKLRLEYDAKLLKVQKHNAKANMQLQGSTVNQDIFRKKLQHAREESDRELAALKRKVSELQTKLSQTQPANPSAKRLRKY